MSLTVWTSKSGISLGTFQEGVQANIKLPIFHTTPSDITFQVISGSLPSGLYIKNKMIVGVPYPVARKTDYVFCIRAKQTTQLSDRTFSLTIEGADAPSFITPSGDLPVGLHDQLFVVDHTEVDYQIQAYDLDTAVGQKLSYFIASGDGILPPGLTLTQEGRIVGLVEPVVSLTALQGNGTYDDSYYDTAPFDFATRTTNGYDTYVYDDKSFDYAEPTKTPAKLNRNYEFKITVSDGDSFVKRTFRIYVVGDDYFRADNTTLFNGTDPYTADVTYLQNPIWMTKSNLGSYKADNYLLIKLDVYDPYQIMYSIDNKANLPPGIDFDIISGDIFGKLPYQPAISRTYTFTVTATRYGDKADAASSSRTFYLTILGNLDSIISWNTAPDLGSITANLPSTLSISATSTLPNTTLMYYVTAGSLPPGITLTITGDLKGNVNQYYDTTNHLKGLITFDSDGTTFDSNMTIFDRTYTFTVTVSDQYNTSENYREFTILVKTPNLTKYSNVSVTPLLSPTHRSLWHSFINDTTVFTPSSLYRSTDKNFGMQSNLTMLVYAGIETTNIEKFISATGLNHKRKRFHFGSVKKAYATAQFGSEVLYEVVYIEMLDPLEPNGKKLPSVIHTNGLSNQPAVLTVDSTGFQISNSKITDYFPNSISNWQERLKKVGLTDRTFLPLWMRTVNTETKHELGFVLAVPLCFCKPGTADKIILNIKNSSFDFRNIDYTVDRYTIDAVDGDTSDKYLVFKNERITI